MLVVFFFDDVPKIFVSTTFSKMLVYFSEVNIKGTEIICIQIETEYYLCSGRYLNMNLTVIPADRRKLIKRRILHRRPSE